MAVKPRQIDIEDVNEADSSIWDLRRALRIIEEWKRRFGLKAPRRIARGTEIFGIGTPPNDIFLLVRGVAALYYRLSEGRETLFLLAYPGDILAITSPEANIPTQTSASSVTSCEVYRLDMHQLQRADADGSVAALLNRSLRIQMARRTKALAELLALSPAERLEHQLCELADVLGVSGNEPVRIPMPLKDYELARLLGLSERQFKRVKTDMQRTGKFTVEDGRIFQLPNCSKTGQFQLFESKTKRTTGQFLDHKPVPRE
jgi:CRP-like cAMP-binding protein